MPGRLIILSIFILLQHCLEAQPGPPVMTGLEVNDDASVLVRWEKPSNLAGFQSYSVYYAPDDVSPFSLVASLTDQDQLSFLHQDADANMRSRYYYMVTEGTPGPSEPTRTIHTIHLSMSTLDNQIVFLNWNAMDDPPFPTPGVSYVVQREYPPGNWQDILTTVGLSDIHIFPYCNDDGYFTGFRIITQDNSVSYPSVSNKHSELLADNNAPTEMPVMDSVSVTPDGEVIIGWQEGLTPDIAGYVIYRVTTINDPIDTVPGKSTTFHTDLSADPCDEPVRYAISAIDSCDNNGLLTQDRPHQTILLEDISYDPCQQVNLLQWSEYINFDPPLEGYRVFVSENDGPFSMLMTLTPGETSFTHAGLAAGMKYTYFIRAFTFSGEKTSSSCRKPVFTYEAPVPEHNYMRYATVNDDDKVELMLYTDPTASVRQYLVERAGDPGGPWEAIAVIEPATLENILFTDSSADPATGSYYYRFTVTDSCGVDIVAENISRTIRLTAEVRPDQTNLLQWNPYEQWLGTVEGYRVWRRMASETAFTLVTTLDAATFEYLDDVSSLSGQALDIYYRIEAFEGPGNAFGFTDQSMSNTVRAAQQPKVLMPNAFAPKGTNNELLPSTVFVGEDGYLFSVYNRWGQLIFETTDPGAGWNGTFNGSYVAQDVYIWVVRFRGPDGGLLYDKGNVLVIF